MADSVIIEFLADTTKLDEAYQKIESSQNEVAAAFKKANADMQSTCLKLSENYYLTHAY